MPELTPEQMEGLARTCAALAFGTGYTAADLAAAATELGHAGYRVAGA